MPNKPVIFAASSSLLLLISSIPGCNESGGSAAQMYKANCASCHGDHLAGGIAPSMLDDGWAHDGSNEAITQQILHGDLTRGMPAFGEVLSDEQVRGLIVYIREQRAKHTLNPPPAPKPDQNQIVTTADHRFRIETVTDDVDTPWGINWLPGCSALISLKEVCTSARSLNSAIESGARSHPRSGIARLIEINVS
jgi:cytochrome c553